MALGPRCEISMSEEMTCFGFNSAVKESVQGHIVSPSIKSNFVNVNVLLTLYYYCDISPFGHPCEEKLASQILQADNWNSFISCVNLRVF
jgi:hypothetical protein